MNILSDRMENSLTARINQELGNKDSPIQILKFANYRQKEQEIQFSVYINFLDLPIPINITFELYILYDYDDDIVTNTSCISKNETILTESAEYFCSSTLNGTDRIIYVSLNLEPKTMLFENIENIQEIYFDEKAEDDSQNLTEIENIIKFGKIKNAEIEFPIKKNSLRIKGDITPKDLLKTNQEIFMRFLTNGKFEIYTCKLDPQNILDCDTSNHPINTTIKDIHLSTSINSSIFFFIELNNWKNNTTAIQIPKPLKKEEIKADDPAYFIEDNILIATEEKNNTKKNAKIQIIKFANFNRTLKHNISFNTYIYFFGRKVVCSRYFYEA